MQFGPGRELMIASIQAAPVEVAGKVGDRFAAMLPAFAVPDEQRITQILEELVGLGCSEFCCVGPRAELLHDSIDSIIEDIGALHVVTTWHSDATEACEYFLYAAGGTALRLVALVREYPQLVVQLEQAALAYGASDSAL